MIKEGDKVICQFDSWYNAHGDEMVIAIGERLTVTETYRLGGAQFLKFDGLPENSGFLSTGFQPLRSYN